MLRKIIVILLGALVLSGCTDNFRGYFKKSANNKLVDSKGFDGEKRKPVYNKKYISLAKQNILESNLEEEEEDDSDDDISAGEKINPAVRNRDMYLKMIKQDAERKKRISSGGDSDNYASLKTASKKIKEQQNSGSTDSEAVKKELAQIKLMLDETRKELAKYNSCPLQKNNANLIAPTAPSINSFSTGNAKVYNSEPKVKKKFLSSEEDYDKKETPCAI